MAFANKVHQAEAQFESLRSTLNIKHSTFNMTYCILTSRMLPCNHTNVNK